MAKFKFRSGDVVLVTNGSDKGKTGKILSVLKSKHQVLVEGINKKQRHQKSNSQQQGGVLSIEKPIDISNVAHSIAGKAAKTKWVLENENKTLVFKSNGKKVRS